MERLRSTPTVDGVNATMTITDGDDPKLVLAQATDSRFAVIPDTEATADWRAAVLRDAARWAFNPNLPQWIHGSTERPVTRGSDPEPREAHTHPDGPLGEHGSILFASLWSTALSRYRELFLIALCVSVLLLALTQTGTRVRSFFSPVGTSVSSTVKPLSKEERLSRLEQAAKYFLPNRPILLVISTPPLPPIYIEDVRSSANGSPARRPPS